MGGTTEEKLPFTETAQAPVKRRLLKTRTGCRTCKLRKVKCDEEKPHCKRCTSTGRRCDGYTHSRLIKATQGASHGQHGTFTDEKLETPRSLTKRLGNSPRQSSVVLQRKSNHSLTFRLVRPAEAGSSLDARELRSYQYFKERTSSDLSSIYDEVFWQRIVFQMSSGDTALRHAVAALGALHESLNSFFNATIPLAYAESQRLFAWQQCNKAIRRLKYHTENRPNIGVALVASILFSTFEFLENRCESGIDQIDAGAGVLYQWRQSVTTVRQTKSELDLVEGQLAPMLTRCKASMGRFLTPPNRLTPPDIKPSTFLVVNWGTRSPVEDLWKPLSGMFDGMQHAKESLWALYDVICSSILSIASVPNHPQLGMAVSKGHDLLRAWRAKFTNYVETQMSSAEFADPDRQRSFRNASQVLQMHCYVFSIIVSTLPIVNEDVFDDHLEDFKKIISLTQTFLELEEEQKKALGCDLPHRNSFSFDLGILPPLWVVASRCRDPAVRRAAFRLFYLGRRREGVWGSVMMAMCVHRLIYIEECGLAKIQRAKEIPLENRIRLVMVRYEPGSMSERIPKR